jgi:hypothetical protein
MQSPTKHVYKARLNTELHPPGLTSMAESKNLPQLPRVVTPNSRSVAPPRVPMMERNLSPRNLSEDFSDMGSATHVQSSMSMPMACPDIHPDTGKKGMCGHNEGG